ncbi:glutamate--cysteine ligase [Mycoplasmatota bacterium]|nr:glutamate--cysteine ligase [Mycoplasmatota bacterium]
MSRNQIELIEAYFKQNEKNKRDFMMGAEFEYFVVDKKTLKVISYDGENGVLSTLTNLLHKGYDGIYDEHHLVGLKKGQSTITLEPGSQLEISLKPEKEIAFLESEYKKICMDIIPILETKNQTLIATGYQVHSRLDEVSLIPKRRYHRMYEYFKSCGIYAHHMMKQTASTQICIDYESESDYQKKYRILNTLSPIFYTFFDNAPFFESETFPKQCIRSQIWDNCDENRCGIIKNSISDDFSYKGYANYLLNQSIIIRDDVNTSQSLYRDLLNPNHVDELEQALSMVFPDVRTRKFIEVRMIDSLPYPLNLSVVAFFKGLFYDEANVNELYQFLKKINIEDVLNAKLKIVEYGIDTNLKDYSIYEVMKYLYTLSYKGLNNKEKKYLLPLMNLIQLKQTPQQLTKTQLNLGKSKALEWCMIQEGLFREVCIWMQAV